MNLVVDNEDRIVYGTQYYTWGILLEVSALILFGIAYAGWRDTGPAAVLVIFAVVGLGLAFIGVGLMFERVGLKFEFAERMCHHRRRGLGGKPIDLSVPFDEIEGLVLLVWKPGPLDHAALPSIHLKVRFKEPVFSERLAEQHELEILQSTDSQTVRKELRRIADRTGLAVIEESRSNHAPTTGPSTE